MKKKKLYQEEAVELLEYTAENLIEKAFILGKTMKVLTPKKLTKRMCISAATRLYDISQKLTPLHLRLKFDLRKLIKESQDCEISPRLERREIVTSNISVNLSSPVLLEEITEESCSDSGEDEEFKSSTSINNDDHDSFDKSEEFEGMVDEETYKTRLAAVQKSVGKTSLRIHEFTPDSITIGDKDTFKADLDKIRKQFQDSRDMLYDLITDLDPALDEARINQLKQIDQQVTTKFKDNDKSVKEAMDDLLAAVDANTKTAEKLKEEKLAEDKKAKFEIRMQNHLKKTKSLNDTIIAIGDCEKMSEQEIRKNLLESKDWEKKLDSLTAAKEIIDEETIGMTFDSNIKKEVDSKFENLLQTVNNKVENLTLRDAELGLYTLAPSKVKENVVYPEPFKGAPGEDVYKFVREFEEAIAADQVRTNDKVKTLVKYLKGEAKEAVGEHHKTLEDALKDLKASYGNPEWIWQTLREDFEKKAHFRAWGKADTVERLKTINLMLNFIRKAEALAEQHQSLHDEVYSSPTISMLKQLVPPNYKDKINHQVPMSVPKTEKIARIFEILETEKDSTLNGIPDKNNYVPKKHEPDHHRAQYGSRDGQNRNKHGHDCTNSPQCNTRWDMLGCIKLYKLATVEERKSMLISMRMCVSCGAPFTKNRDGKHKCKWLPTEKLQARCQGYKGSYQCHRAAAMCFTHTNNASRKLKSWLTKSNTKFVVRVVDSKPSIIENQKEREDLIKLLRSEDGNLDTILSSYQSKRKPNVKSFDRKKSQSGDDKIVPHLLDRAFDDISTPDDMQADETKEHIEDEDTPPLEKKPVKIFKKERKKKKTEIENLKIDNWEPPRNAKRTKNLSNLVNSNSTYPDEPPIIGLELMPNIEEEGEVGDMGRLLNGEEGEVLNEQNPVILL